MTTQAKTILNSALISGSVYAILIAGFDYYDEQAFSLGKFLFNLFFFGAFMGFFTGYQLRKQAKKEK